MSDNDHQSVDSKTPVTSELTLKILQSKILKATSESIREKYVEIRTESYSGLNTDLVKAE